jgi:hypothetical protein
MKIIYISHVGAKCSLYPMGYPAAQTNNRCEGNYAHKSSQKNVKGVLSMSDRSVRPTQEEIERRAYEIYVSRGRQNGGDLGDWLTAEQELRGQQSGTSQTKRPVPILTGAVMERTALLTEQNPQDAARENVMRQSAASANATRDNAMRENAVRESPARENTARETAERESETHFKLPRYFSGSNP